MILPFSVTNLSRFLIGNLSELLIIWQLVTYWLDSRLISFHFALRSSFTVRFTKLLTNGFQSLFEIPKVRYELSNFIMYLSIKLWTWKWSCEFHAELHWEVNKFIVREVPTIRWNCLEISDWQLRNKIAKFVPNFGNFKQTSENVCQKFCETHCNRKKEPRVVLTSTHSLVLFYPFKPFKFVVKQNTVCC